MSEQISSLHALQQCLLIYIYAFPWQLFLPSVHNFYPFHTSITACECIHLSIKQDTLLPDIWYALINQTRYFSNMTFTTGQPTTRQSTVGWKKGPVVPADLTGMSHYDGVRIFPMQGGGTMTAGLQWVDKKPESGEAPSRMSEIGANPFSGALHAYNGFTIPYPEESTKFSVAMSEYCMRHVEWVVKPNPNGVASRFETLAYEQLYTIDRNWDGIKCQERTAPLVRPILSLCVHC